MENKTVIVIGAANMDICGRPKKANLRDSNPGSITLSPGGVGRNIAHNLKLMGLNVKFIAAFGDDPNGDALMKSCETIGFDMYLSRVIPGERTSGYLYVTDDRGDMLIGVADMDIARHITPEHLCAAFDEINAADAVVIDANLTPETIRWIGENVTAPIYADPVSTVKAERLKPILDKLYAMKPNELEAVSMTGESDPEAAARALAAAGVKRVFVSMGEKGILAAEGDTLRHFPCGEIELINATGCGDSATAALVWAGVQGLDLAGSARAAIKAAAITAAYDGAVSPYINS